MVVTVYISSASGSNEIRKKQNAVTSYLSSKRIAHETIDLNAETRKAMLEKIPEEMKEEGKKFLPPQVFNGDHYCGDYEMFFNANENESAYTFFQIDSPPDKTIDLAAENEEENLPEKGIIEPGEKTEDEGSRENDDNKEGIDDDDLICEGEQNVVEPRESQTKDE